jgi:hypothetical protein
LSITEENWREVEADLPASGRLNARRGLASVDALLAVDHKGLRHLLIPVASPELLFSDRRSRGLVLMGRSLEVEERPQRPFLDLCCAERSGNEAFNLVTGAVLDQLQANIPGPTAVRSVLDRWRRFWGQPPPEGLTIDQIRGLFGELWFLLMWLLPKNPNNVRRWVGPLAARHDFEWPDYSVEAKTTASVRGHIHHISALDQLDPPERGGLLVFSLRIREEASATNSLITLIGGIMEALKTRADLTDIFEDVLATGGYSPLHDYRYQDLRFRIVSERLYRVAEGFPRLSASNLIGGLPLGVESVEYEVNLEVCANLIVCESAADFQRWDVKRLKQ